MRGRIHHSEYKLIRWESDRNSGPNRPLTARNQRRLYHEHQYFVPRDERGNRGYSVADPCANCGAPYMSHFNGHCPKKKR